MKATEIRDKIMDWLGFTKIINPLTGEISWILGEGSTRLKTILNVLKTAVGLIAGIKIIGRLRNLITLLATGEKTGLKPFSSGLVGITNAIKGSINWVKNGITNYKALRDAGYGVGSALKETASGMAYVIPTAVKATAGIAGLAVSFYGAYDAMKDYSEGTKSAERAFTQLGVSVAGAAASGALLGSVIPGIGTAAGAIIGAIAGAAAGMAGYKTDTDKFIDSIKDSNDAIQKHIDEWNGMKTAIEDTVDTQFAEIGYTESLVSELDTLVDANGKVKAGYEDRVNFILNQLNEAYGTEYQLINGQISNYKTLKDTIYDAIEAKKAEILLEANQAIYAEAIKNRTQAYQDWQTAINNTKNAENELRTELEKHGLTLEDYTNRTAKYTSFIGMHGNVISGVSSKIVKLGDAYKESASKVDGAKQYWEDTNNTIIQWEDLKTAVITGNTEQIEKKLQELTSNYKTESGEQTQTLLQKLQMEKRATEQYGKDTYTIALQYLAETTNGVKKLSNEQIEAWQYLARNDRDAYNKALDGLDDDAKKLVQSVTKNIILETDNALPGVKRSVGNIRSSMGELSATFTANPKVTIDPNVELNTYGLRTKLNNLNEILSSTTANGLVSKSYTDNISSIATRLRNISKYASGGLPGIGELFVAREAGPELVGSIGNRNAVVNNQQIVEAVSSGVAKAVSGVLGNNGSSYQLIIDGEQITNVVQRRIARRANITGMAMGV